MPITAETIFGAHEEVYFKDVVTEEQKGPYKFGPFTQYDRARVIKMMNRLVQTPLQSIGPRLEDLPEPERTRLFNEARKASLSWVPPSPSSFMGQTLIQEDPDISYDFWRIAMQARNTVTDDEIDAIWKILAPDTFVQIMRISLGLDDPKARLSLGGENLTPEERTSLEKHLSLQQKVSALQSPFAWMKEFISSN